MNRRDWLALSYGTLAVALALGGASVAFAKNDKVKQRGNHDISSIHSIGVTNSAFQKIGHGGGNVGNQGPNVNPAAAAIAVPAVAGPAATIGTGQSTSVTRSAPGAAPSAFSGMNPGSPGNSGNSHGHGNANGHGNVGGPGNAFGQGNGRGDISRSGWPTSGKDPQRSTSSVKNFENAVKTTSAVSKESGKSSGQPKGEGEAAARAESRQTEAVAAAQPIESSAAVRIPMPSCN